MDPPPVSEPQVITFPMEMGRSFRKRKAGDGFTLMGFTAQRFAPTHPEMVAQRLKHIPVVGDGDLVKFN